MQLNSLLRAACVRCHGTKCPLTAFFSEGVIVCFWYFALGFKSQKNKIWGVKKLGDMKWRENLSEMFPILFYLPSLPDMCADKFLLVLMGVGWGSTVRRTGREDPHWCQQKWKCYLNIWISYCFLWFQKVLGPHSCAWLTWSLVPP